MGAAKRALEEKEALFYEENCVQCEGYLDGRDDPLRDDPLQAPRVVVCCGGCGGKMHEDCAEVYDGPYCSNCLPFGTNRDD